MAKGGGGGGGGFEIAVDQQTRALDRNFEGVSDSG